MSDQCKFCSLRGDLKNCEEHECFQRENWWSEQVIKRTSRKDDLLAEAERVLNLFTEMHWCPIADECGCKWCQATEVKERIREERKR